jgi:hypothetical protein
MLSLLPLRLLLRPHLLQLLQILEPLNMVGLLLKHMIMKHISNPDTSWRRLRLHSLVMSPSSPLVVWLVVNGILM